MAFFKKLKDRLFKSSSKIDEGLDAIVEDGGAEEEVRAVDGADDALSPEGTSDLPPDTPVEPTLPETKHAAPFDANAVLDHVSSLPKDQADAFVNALPADQQEQYFEAWQKASDAEFARIQAEMENNPVTPEEAAALEEADPWVEPEPKIDDILTEALDDIERDLKALEADKATASDTPIDPEPAETPDNVSEPVAEALPEPTPEEQPKPGLMGRLLGRSAPSTVVRRALDDDMLEQIEELLITADMGVDTAMRVTANMSEGRFGKKFSTAELKDVMATEIARIMEPVARPLPIYPKRPQVVLVVGVNGSGKTTTIGKLASQFKAAGKSVVIAAGDTFRAAAVEQLQVWGDRAGVPVMTAPEGSDPASLAFDAMAKAEADGADLLMIDTAGRLQNRADLMEELAKIVRVIRKKDPEAPHNTLLVLDATTGQNALSQVKTFQEIADVSGLVMTKLDGTAKGGVLVALADKFGLPIHAIGVGEQIDDLDAFDPREFAAALTGLDA